MEDQPRLTLPARSRKKNTPKRCPRPLHAQSSAQKESQIQHGCQGNDLIVVKMEPIDQEHECAGRDERPAEEGVSPQRRAGEEIPPGTSRKGSRKRNLPEKCPRPSYTRDSAQEDQKILQDDQSENIIAVKVEVKEEAEEAESVREAEPVRGEKRSAEEEISSQSPGRGKRPVTEDDISKNKSGKVRAPNKKLDKKGSRNSISCNDCGKSFLRKSQLIFHRRIHMAEKPHPCSDCGRRFRLKDHLHRHRVTHTGDKPYSCEHCGKLFTQKSSLSRHVALHSGEKPYSCSDCGKSYRQKSTLVKHQQVALMKKPFSCLDCGKSFEKMSILIGHQRTHTETPLPRMEEEPRHMTQRVLQLTLEIIYLLTGENYVAFKLCDSLVAPSLTKTHSFITEAPPPSLIPENMVNKKIQDVMKEIIELLMGEEKGCLEGHGDLYKAAMMEEEQLPLTHPEGFRKSQPSERWPHPLFSQDSAQEELSTPQDPDDEDLDIVEVKAEAREEEPVRGEEQNAEEEIFPQISTEHQSPVKFEEEEGRVKIKMKYEESEPVRGDGLSAEEQIFPQISTDGRYRRNNMEDNISVSGNRHTEDEDITAYSSGEALEISNLQPVPHSSDLSSDLSRQGESFLNPPRPNAFQKHYRRILSSKGGRSFTWRAKLLTHKRIHLREAPYSCSKCGKGFTLIEDLLKHFQCHPEDKLYLCSYCTKPFLSKFCLDRHELIHTGQKPYCCSVCGIRFTQKSNLARHERTHTGERPFSCPECGKTYTRKANLVEHCQSHK